MTTHDCNPCNCRDLGCAGRCDVLALPVYAPASDFVEVRVTVGHSDPVRMIDHVEGGEPVLVDLERVGRVGLARIEVLGECYEVLIQDIVTI